MSFVFSILLITFDKQQLITYSSSVLADIESCPVFYRIHYRSLHYNPIVLSADRVAREINTYIGRISSVLIIIPSTVKRLQVHLDKTISTQ